jgi:hypothetical protein
MIDPASQAFAQEITTRRFNMHDLVTVASQLPSYMSNHDQKRRFGQGWTALSRHDIHHRAVVDFCWQALPHLDLAKIIPYRGEINRNLWMVIVRHAEQLQGVEGSLALQSLNEPSTAKPHSVHPRAETPRARHSGDIRQRLGALALRIFGIGRDLD